MLLRIGIVSKFGAADGLCVRAEAVLKGLIKLGHEIHIFTQSKVVDFVPPERIHMFSAVQLNPHFSLDALDSVRMIAKESQKHDLDLLHLQMNSGSTEFFLPLVKESLPPLVLTFHLAYASGGSFYTTLFAVAWKLSLYASKRYDSIVLVDPSQKPYFLQYGFPEDKLTIIGNGVDTEQFKPKESAKESNENIEFVYVGRLSYDKGVNTLLESFRDYHRENPNSRLTLVGDGMLKFQIDEFNENGSIRWLGSIPHDKLPQVLQNSDVFTIPQNIGGLGLSVLEAMSCGLPVITTAIGETTRLLGSNEGVLVEPKNKSAIVDAMRKLANDAQLRKSMGEHCRNKILREYSWVTQIHRLEKVYEQVIS
jgi:glycosyltransferase involved in cell wall biosynthesis